MTLYRDDALKALIPHVKDDDIVVAVYQSCFDWLALNPRPLNYVAVGAMGQASSHGLGLALANPDRRVFVFDGDGGRSPLSAVLQLHPQRSRSSDVPRRAQGRLIDARAISRKVWATADIGLFLAQNSTA